MKDRTLRGSTYFVLKEHPARYYVSLVCFLLHIYVIIFALVQLTSKKKTWGGGNPKMK